MSSPEPGYLPPAERIRQLQAQRRSIDIDQLQDFQIKANAAAVDGLDRDKGIERLRRNGCPPLVAAELIDEALSARTHRMRGYGLAQLVGSVIGMLLSVVIWQSLGEFGSADDGAGNYIEGRADRRREGRLRWVAIALFFGGFAGATNGAITMWKGDDEEGAESDII